MVPDDMICPHCGSKNFSIVGFFKRGFEQPYVDGKPIKEGLSLGQQSIQSVEGVFCKLCGIHTIIEDNDVFEREMIIFDLQTENQILKGKTVTSSGKEWKN